MEKCCFNIERRQTKQGTRKYSRIDFRNLVHSPIFVELSLSLTQLTFDYCKINSKVLHGLLQKNADTLELLIIDRSKLTFFKDKEGKQVELRQVHLPRLKTLILLNLDSTSGFIAVSIIRTTNLTELGLVRTSSEPCTLPGAEKLFFDLIKCNSKLKILHITQIVTEVFIVDALNCPEVKHRFKS